MAVGYNNIDVAAARERKVVVTNTPDVLNEACAALTWGLILGVTRRLGEGERILRAGQWKGFQLDFLLGMDLVGKTLGVIGMGRIGQAVAAKAAAFGMRTVYMKSPRRPDEQIVGPDGVPYEGLSFEEVMKQSDVITLHVPLSPETRHLVNREQHPVDEADGVPGQHGARAGGRGGRGRLGAREWLDRRRCPRRVRTRAGRAPGPDEVRQRVPHSRTSAARPARPAPPCATSRPAT